MRRWDLVFGCAVLAAGTAQAGPIETVIVTGRAQDLTGIAASANQGTVSAADLEQRPLLRPGEVVEEIPGVIITQHSGSGKANQYFLRGFNLDHGTDLAISVDGVPVNMPTHAHGQGYADLNFLMPELVESVAYKKGPYYADVGDFGSAGAFDILYYDRLPEGFARIEAGQFGYARAMIADNVALGGGNAIAALSFEHNDGPWDRGDDERKIDGLVRFTQGAWTVTAAAYHNVWRSTDQIPDRAIAGLADPVGAPVPAATISRWGAIDPTDGGQTGRYSLSAAWRGDDAAVQVYGMFYNLHMFSDFTYFLDDPVHGDQFLQADQRYVFGGAAHKAWQHGLFGGDSETRAGIDLRSDIIQNGLFHTERRAILGTEHSDDVTETSASPYIENETRWNTWLRTIVGLRGDLYWMDVVNKAGGASGSRSSQVVSPKVNVIFGPWDKTEFYVDFGQGFHSNDARGTVQAVDPATPLPRSTGAEFGVRSSLIPGLKTELSLWWLHLQSELVWAGDAGDTESSGPTDRIGVELANWYTPTSWLTFDADYAYSQARFSRFDSAGQRVPEALQGTFDGGVAVHDLPGGLAPWTAGLRLRYFGPRPLTQDGAVHSHATTLVYADLGYRFANGWALSLDVFNLLDARTSDIDYFYTSRLPGEPLTGVDDVHTHPSEPREVRLSLTTAL
ncbi:MAG: TonB-dependent receptor [Proteobacteria bacterium]|nr:TonB-dependent receptor [Pseudomonadota bacterium]